MFDAALNLAPLERRKGSSSSTIDRRASIQGSIRRRGVREARVRCTAAIGVAGHRVVRVARVRGRSHGRRQHRHGLRRRGDADNFWGTAAVVVGRCVWLCVCGLEICFGQLAAVVDFERAVALRGGRLLVVCGHRALFCCLLGQSGDLRMASGRDEMGYVGLLIAMASMALHVVLSITPGCVRGCGLKLLSANLKDPFYGQRRSAVKYYLGDKHVQKVLAALAR
ncbi:hypothetical protein BKA81DRAFT_50035 [Phyllosticta paracitricarpa]